MTEFQGSEDQLWRPAPRTPYIYNGRTLTISNELLGATYDAFAEFARRRVEACCFWYGILDASGNGRANCLLIPRQVNRWGSFNIAGNSMARAAEATRGLGLRNLAQIHTHPGTFIEHSMYDDENVNSRQALSLVFPSYGVRKGKWPEGIGIHEFQSNYWYLLPDTDARKRVGVASGLVPVILDLR